MKLPKTISVLTLTAGLLVTSNLQHATAITIAEEQSSIISRDIMPRQFTVNLVSEMKAFEEEQQFMRKHQIKVKQEQMAELERLKQVELERLKQIELQKQELNNFINMVNSINVKTLNLRTPSNLTPNQANEVLQGTGLDGLGEAFVNAEKNYGVNAYYLMSHAAVESSWGKSKISKLKNNLFGFTAYDASPGTSATTFKSKAHSIDFVAKYISIHYLSEDGQYYNGPNLKGMNVMYASDEEWANVISQVFDQLVDKTVVPGI